MEDTWGETGKVHTEGVGGFVGLAEGTGVSGDSLRAVATERQVGVCRAVPGA